MIGWTF